MKQQVREFHCTHLQSHVLMGWRGVTVAKLLRQAQWRQAVRHHHTSTLGKGMSAWQSALRAAARKQQWLVQAQQQYSRQLQKRAWLVSFQDSSVVPGIVRGGVCVCQYHLKSVYSGGIMV